MTAHWIENIAIFSSVAMPLFNIPLIFRMVRRGSSQDLSLSWALGVWVCIILMTPQALNSPDIAFKTFGVVNLIFFSLVAFFVIKYRLWPKKK